MRSDKPIGHLFKNRPDYRTFFADPELPMSDKYVGIEIEAEGVPFTNDSLASRLQYWTTIADGSLREYGTEFVSAMLRGRDIWNALEELSSVLSKCGISPIFSERTSVHVHVDSRVLNVPQIKTLILHYLILEPYIFKYIGQGREDNSYCVPYYKNSKGIRNLSELFREQIEESTIMGAIQAGVKYEAMNVQSIARKGSIEFRHYYGTHDPRTIYTWVKVLLSLFNFAKQSSEAEIYEAFRTRPYVELLYDITQYFPIRDNIDLSWCEATARESVAQLLLSSSQVDEVYEELQNHKPPQPQPQHDTDPGDSF